MNQVTETLQSPGALLRLDPKSGSLKERSYQVMVVSGPDAGLSAKIAGSLTVGSHPDANFSLTDTTVSRYHVELSARPDGVRVRDLDSRNGTYLAGTRIQEVIIEDSAVVTVGKTGLKVSMVEEDLGVPEALATFGKVMGSAPAMHQLFGILDRVAPTDSTVLVLGETGTGKEILAEAIHAKSKRVGKPFVVVDCGAVAPTLIESELFGHVRGAFTGAVNDRNGAFLEADGGTIFLDELGELPLDLQPKLLRVLEGGTVVGSVKTNTGASTCASLRRPIETSKKRSKRAGFDETSTTGWPWCWCRCRRCAIGSTTYRSWRNTSWRSWGEATSKFPAG